MSDKHPCDKCTVKNEHTGETKKQEKLHNPYACHDVPEDKCLLEKHRREGMENHVLLDPRDVSRSQEQLSYMLHRYQNKYASVAELYKDEEAKTEQLQSEIDRLKAENEDLRIQIMNEQENNEGYLTRLDNATELNTELIEALEIAENNIHLLSLSHPTDYDLKDVQEGNVIIKQALAKARGEA
jgi:hypothetical protein